jgi:hypothetical protein
VGAKKNNISQIDKYLKGNLDAKAMHRLEREAQDDPFLMAALEGYEKAGTNQQANLADLEARLQARAADKKPKSVLLWRILPIAACLLLMLGAGYWFLKPAPDKPQYANVAIIDKNEPPTNASPPSGKPLSGPSIVNKAPGALPILKAVKPNLIARNQLKKKSQTEDLLKKMEELEIDSAGAITKQGNAIAQMRVNGKEYSGGGVKQAIKNLPASSLEKIEVIDDYAFKSPAAPVIRGYVKRNKDEAFGSSYVVTGKEVQDNPVGNVEQLLQGKVQGLNIQNNTGAPGMRGSVNIRGLSPVDSSKAGKFPLYWVKGVVIDSKTKAPIGAAELSQGGSATLQTKIDGTFEFLNIGPSLLTVTMPGYLPKQIKINEKADLTIELKKDNSVNAETDTLNCKENLKFKARFFANIAIAEKYTMEQSMGLARTVTNKQFLQALKYISHYTLVSIRTDLKDQSVYYGRRTFGDEKAKWLKWYETNKCRGLK